MIELYGLSIQQPWLDLILKGKKTIELRSWAAKRRGMIALHSPLNIDYSVANFFGYNEPWKLVRGKVLGVADIIDVYLLDDKTADEYVAQHLQVMPLHYPTFGFKLNNIKTLKNPIPLKGNLNFFPIFDEKLHEILAEL